MKDKNIIKLSKNGYEKIDANIKAIEDCAYAGMFSDKDAASGFQQIAAETKKLRQTLLAELLIVPASAVLGDDGDAA